MLWIGRMRKNSLLSRFNHDLEWEIGGKFVNKPRPSGYFRDWLAEQVHEVFRVERNLPSRLLI